MARLEGRIDALEAQRGTLKGAADMTDAELMRLYLTANAGLCPSAAEVAEWLALPDDELSRRLSAPRQSL